MTNDLRNGNQLFVSSQRPHEPVTTDTIRRWVKLMMAKAGVNMSEYGAHSVRRAATSAIRVGGAPSDDVMNSVSWRSEKPVARHYDKSNIEIMKNDMCICLINGIFSGKRNDKEKFRTQGNYFYGAHV